MKEEESNETKPFENRFEFWADKARNEKNTCLKLQRIRRKVSIPPSYMGNLKSACTTLLDKSLTKYDADISGTLVAYNDKTFKSMEQTVSLKNRPGEAYLNFTLEVDVVIFGPEPGSFLRAVCIENRLTNKSHTALLAMETFNCVLSHLNEENNMKEEEIEVNDEVRFEVESIEIDWNGLLMVKGNSRSFVVC